MMNYDCISNMYAWHTVAFMLLHVDNLNACAVVDNHLSVYWTASHTRPAVRRSPSSGVSVVASGDSHSLRGPLLWDVPGVVRFFSRWLSGQDQPIPEFFLA